MLHADSMRMRPEGLGVAEPGVVGCGVVVCGGVMKVQSHLFYCRVVRAKVEIDKPPQEADGRAVAAVPVQRPLGLGGHRLLSCGCRYFDCRVVEVVVFS